jgi:signal transduction histidine kinase
MSRGVSLFLRLMSLSAGRRLALVLAALAVSLGLYGLAFPATYFEWALALPLVCAAWLFGWRGGLLCLAGLTLALGVGYRVVSGSVFWQPARFAPFLTGMFYELIVCLAVVILRRVTCALLDERQSAARLQQAYQQEHALNEWKDQALQDLNHELRIPLTQTDGYLELLETYRDNLDAATQAHFIALARGGCDELLHLISTAMETIQTSGTQQPVHASVFLLRQEVHATLAHCDSRLLRDHRVELEIPDSIQVYADARFVRQIMRNLLTNACKYTPAGTPIVVSASLVSAADHPHKQAGMVCVSVQDRGPGIPPEQHDRVFQRFERLRNAATSAQPGSGLGLAICKQLIETMGGTIWVESAGRDSEGSCFSFTLADGSQSTACGLVKRYGEIDGKAEARLQNQQETLAVSVLQ